MKRHVFIVDETNETAIHSGRMRYRVECASCNVLVHEATTGPGEMVSMHIRDVESAAGSVGHAPSFVLSDAERNAMTHCLGLDQSKTTYRNFYMCMTNSEMSRLWDGLCRRGLARGTAHTDQRGITYTVTDLGRLALGFDPLPDLMLDVLGLRTAWAASEAHLQEAWSEATVRPGYRKQEWQERQNRLSSAYRARLAELGDRGPMVYPAYPK